MRPLKSASATPACAKRDPRIDLLPGKIECTHSPFDIGRQAGRVVLGVDIGLSGALAVLTEAGELVSVGDMPVLADGPAKRRSVNAPLAELVAKSHAMRAFVEFVGPRPQEGAVGAFAFGRRKGAVEGLLAALGLPVQFLTAPVWKRVIGIAPGKAGAKDAARSAAIARWPEKAALFARIKDDGRAEAALIGVAKARSMGVEELARRRKWAADNSGGRTKFPSTPSGPALVSPESVDGENSGAKAAGELFDECP
jgi:crossover junction endodeoxyribonuclease RuvC